VIDLVLYVPLQITLCLTFLYQILSWSAFVGFAVMLAFLPIPGYVAAKLQRAQKEKMKKVRENALDVFADLLSLVLHVD
jgi:hypothetical protein